MTYMKLWESGSLKLIWTRSGGSVHIDTLDSFWGVGWGVDFNGVDYVYKDSARALANAFCNDVDKSL